MSRAARRRAEREARRTPGTEVKKGNPQIIKLANPVDQHFETFIFGNALHCDDVVAPDTKQGKTVVICGAGPSLADHADEWCHDADELWGCNSALPWLVEHGYPVTHGITVDQTPAMVVEWGTAPDVEYLVASTIHPHLTDHLLSRGRRLRWFHNFVGIKKDPVLWCSCGHDEEPHHAGGVVGRLVRWCRVEAVARRWEWLRRSIYRCRADDCECREYDPQILSYEDWLYVTLFPPTIRAGSGLNTCSRAIDIALTMGFDKIIVLGADCALRVKRRLPPGTEMGSPEHRRWLEEDTQMHADGGHALASGATPVTIGGEIDGKWWETKPDMAVTAVFMHKLREAAGDDRLVFVGDTLVNALRGKSQDFLDRLPTLQDSEGNPIPVSVIPAPVLTTGPDRT